MSGADSGLTQAWLQAKGNCVSVRVRARPRSSRRGLIRADLQALLIGVSSPADEGRANDELIFWLARTIGVPRSAVSIARGATSRDKLISIATDRPDAVIARLIELAEAR